MPPLAWYWCAEGCHRVILFLAFCQEQHFSVVTWNWFYNPGGIKTSYQWILVRRMWITLGNDYINTAGSCLVVCSLSITKRPLKINIAAVEQKSRNFRVSVVCKKEFAAWEKKVCTGVVVRFMSICSIVSLRYPSFELLLHVYPTRPGRVNYPTILRETYQKQDNESYYFYLSVPPMSLG